MRQAISKNMTHSRVIRPFFIGLCVFFFLPQTKLSAGNLVVEAGVLTSQKLSISSGSNRNATEGWGVGVIPSLRAEFWLQSADSFDFGVVLAPLLFRASEKLTSDITVGGTNFTAGTLTGLDFQFHNLRLAANYPVFSWNEGKSSLRLGLTALFNYAQFIFTSQNSRGVEVDALAVPILRIDLRQVLDEKIHFVLHGDFLPLSPSLDSGFFDFFVGLKLESFEPGLRFFWGGFSEEGSSQTNNATFFTSFVVRGTF